MYRLRALFGGERRRSCPGQYILGTLDGRAMEQKEWEGVSSALNRANPGVLSAAAMSGRVHPEMYSRLPIADR